MNFLKSILLLTLLTLTHSIRLRIFGANQNGGIRSWSKGPILRGRVFRVCPTDLPQPFTLACLSPSRVEFAEFFVDGEMVRREGVRPFIITGDADGRAKPWTPPSDNVEIRCRLSNGEEITRTIVFVCPDGSTGLPPPTTRPPTTTPPTFGLNSGTVGRDCVKIPALSTSDRAGWTVQSGGLFFRPTGTPGAGSLSVTPAGQVVAEYTFTAPRDGRYGFTLDMSTSGFVDHNDVWVEFPSGGFTLTRGSSVRTATGWTKAYHNRNTRSNQVFSVDFDPHTFATRNSLKMGNSYTVRVGGRSTRTGFFSIIMFPCSGGQCDGTNPNNEFWRGERDACASS